MFILTIESINKLIYIEFLFSFIFIFMDLYLFENKTRSSLGVAQKMMFCLCLHCFIYLFIYVYACVISGMREVNSIGDGFKLTNKHFLLVLIISLKKSVYGNCFDSSKFSAKRYYGTKLLLLTYDITGGQRA